MYTDLDPRNDLQPHLPRILNRDVYYKGQTIIEQGGTGNRAFYIESGAVEIIMRDGPHEVCIGTVGAGEIFGEMALIERDERSATVRAVRDTTVTVIHAQDLEQKINGVGDPAIAALIHVYIDRLRAANKSQVAHYKNFAEFQDRIAGLVEKTIRGVDHEKRQQFRDEVTPLLEQLDALLESYRNKPR